MHALLLSWFILKQVIEELGQIGSIEKWSGVSWELGPGDLLSTSSERGESREGYLQGQGISQPSGEGCLRTLSIASSHGIANGYPVQTSSQREGWRWKRAA